MNQATTLVTLLGADRIGPIGCAFRYGNRSRKGAVLGRGNVYPGNFPLAGVAVGYNHHLDRYGGLGTLAGNGDVGAWVAINGTDGDANRGIRFTTCKGNRCGEQQNQRQHAYHCYSEGHSQHLL